ncbi:MAG: DVUA0089 family protein [Treponema sp.]|nr:DVUA0089 family protein [Treponema sp.]
MKKVLICVCMFVFVLSICYAQTTERAETENTVEQFDQAVRNLANSIHAKFTEKKAEKVSIGQFIYQDSSTPFSVYWVNHLIGELTNTRGRNYSIFSGSAPDSEWLVSGEIVFIGNIVRIYTTLIQLPHRSIEASFFSSFQRDEIINDLISSGSRGSSSSASSSVVRDSREPDSWENPVQYTIGANQNAAVINRTITDGDEDFFLLVPGRDGRLTMETTGSTDTYMVFYNYESSDELASNDDGGNGNNAKIVFNVRGGTRYLAVVKGYESGVTGAYGFRAFITVREGASSWENPVSYEIGEDENNVVTVNRSIQGGDEDYFLLVPKRNGRVVIETTGRIDTFMELFDAADRDEVLDENDDGGSNYNARIRYSLEVGKRYIAKVKGYELSSSGSYGFRAYFPGSGLLPKDEHEPNDEPSNATLIELDKPQEHTFHSKDDIDWFTFQITRAGKYIIQTKGTKTNRLDTYIELFDSNINSIAEDDDGGNSLSSLIAMNLNRGTYYLKVWCLDEEPDQGYTISLTSE